MRHLIIYHQIKPGLDCPDGITAAAIAAEALGDCELLGYCYNMPLPSDIAWENYKSIYILDFSFPPEEMQKLIKKNSNVVVIDHHKTAAENFRNIKGCYSLFDISRSACEITWDYFHPDISCPGIISYIGDRDTWKWQLPDSKEINCALSALRSQYGSREIYQRYKGLSILQLRHQLLLFGQKKYQERQKRIKEIAKKFKYGFDTLSKKFFLFGEIEEEESSLTSDVAEYLYNKESRPLGYVAVYGKNSLAVALRSKQGTKTDVSAIAKKFGGGGHFHAAGFSRKSLKDYPLKISFWGQVEGFIRSVLGLVS